MAYLQYQSQDYVAFGENTTVGSWRGASTDGGTSLAIVRNSQGLVIPFFSQWWKAFAGLHLFAGVGFPYTPNPNNQNANLNDIIDSTSYGTQVAVPYVMTPSASIHSGYTAAISSVSEGTGCPRSGGGFSWNSGMTGCGCHVIMTVSPTAAGGSTVIEESWTALNNDSPYQTGTGYYYFYWGCNYYPNNSYYSSGP
jgi:hypothetical protein